MHFLNLATDRMLMQCVWSPFTFSHWAPGDTNRLFASWLGSSLAVSNYVNVNVTVLHSSVTAGKGWGGN